MKEEVFTYSFYSSCYRVDKQLLMSLEDIFRRYCEDLKLEISVECSNSMGYVFESLNELFETFARKQYRIVKVSLEASYGEKYNRNKVVVTFDNNSNNSKVLFSLNSNDDYIVLKNKIDDCLKNSKLSYGILAKIPITSVLLTLIFMSLCIYTWINNIVFSKSVQYMIYLIYFVGWILSIFLPIMNVWKRQLFPCVEFRIGSNTKIEEKHEKMRNFLLGTVLMGIIIGVVVNIISKFIL